MLRKLISAALWREAAGRDHQGRPAPDLDFPPMVVVRAPKAENDNPLTKLCAAVEADLRAAGYLR